MKLILSRTDAVGAVTTGVLSAAALVRQAHGQDVGSDADL